MSKNKILGKWAWENTDPLERHIEFIEEKGLIHLKIILKDQEEKLESLTIQNKNTEDNSEYWHFGNFWWSKDQKKLFGFESRYAGESKLTGTFTNVNEFSLDNNNKLKQLWMGFRFDKDKEEWVAFKEEVFLIRVE